jgi:hypothetical protein
MNRTKSQLGRFEYRHKIATIVCLLAIQLVTVRAAEEDMELIRAVVVAAVKASRFKSLLCNPQGHPRDVTLSAADETGITVAQDGAELRMEWKQLKPLEIYYLGRGLLTKGSVDDHLLLARVALKLNVGSDMDKLLERLEFDAPNDVARIETIRAQIKSAAQPPVVPAPETAVAQVSTQSKTPAFSHPLLFDTPEADAVLAATQILPPEHPFNQEVSSLPLHANSAAMIASVGPETILWPEQDMNYVVVPPDQKKVPLKLKAPNAESDPGPFPIPDNAPLEEWPIAFPGVPLEKYQREGEGDRHVLVVDPLNGLLHEFFYAFKTDAGWEASIAVTFNLNTFKLRPVRWSSADAAGLPIFPAVVKFYECERGIVPHAMRFAVKQSRKDFIFPARHCASNAKNPLDPDLPRMGERFRLRADFDISSFPPHVQAILRGLKKYGMVLADNTGNLGASLSIAPDRRIKGLDALKKIKFKDFEVVQTPNESKR